jgi:hypothetical protein
MLDRPSMQQRRKLQRGEGTRTLWRGLAGEDARPPPEKSGRVLSRGEEHETGADLV